MDANARKLRRQFYDVLRNFEAVTGQETDDRFVWYMAARVLDASGCGRKEDLMVFLQERMFENRGSSAYYLEMKNNSEEYRETERKYRLSGRVEELGEFWRGLIKRRDIDTIQRTADWLKMTDNYLIVNVFKLVTCWEQSEENYENRDNMKERKKSFNQNRREIQQARDLFLNIMEVIKLLS